MNCAIIIKSLRENDTKTNNECGQVSEWFKELVLKTSDTATYRGFESHPVRHIFYIYRFADLPKW